MSHKFVEMTLENETRTVTTVFVLRKKSLELDTYY